MIRKTVLILALAALLVPAFASAAEPATSTALVTQATTSATAAPAVPLPDLGQLLSPGSCPAPTPSSLPGGCSRTCKVDRDCRYYPEEVCLSGCCVF